jgi:hypothetical protein
MAQSTSQAAPRPHHPPKLDAWTIQRRIRRSGLSFAAKTLLCAVLDYDRFGQSPGGCTASLERLGADIGVSARYVARLLVELLRNGWLRADPQRGNIRPLRMGKACTDNHGTDGVEADCTYEQSVPAPRNDRCLHLGTDGAVEGIREERREKNADPARPPDGRPVSAPGDDAPRLDDGREIPPGFQVHGGRSLLELCGITPAQQACAEAELIREGKLRRRKPAG